MVKRKAKKFFQGIINSEKSGGMLLMAALILSLLLANSSYNDHFESILSYTTGIGSMQMSLTHWINDGLMAIFFLLVGLEIKKELVEGELADFKKAALPIIAAIGGMIVPALIYTAINWGSPTAHGWGIPMATDIAFAIAVLSLLGNRVHPALKVFLIALAIVDDLGAILVVAIFYTAEIHWLALGIAFLLLGILITLNKLKVMSLWIYLIPGLVLWYFMHHSGIHATIAGVLLAFCIPLKHKSGASPLNQLEHILAKPVNLIIMPVFALANTNISLNAEMFSSIFSSLGLAIILGLFVGKTIGVFGSSFLAVKLGVAKLPKNTSWATLAATGTLAGIGFTMSIFIAMLSFDDKTYVDTAKISILTASFLSGLVAYTLLRLLSKSPKVK